MPSRTVRLPTPSERSALEDYWRFRAEHRDEIATRLQARLGRFAPGALDGGCVVDADHERLLHDAIFGDGWEAYIGSLRARGESYAQGGVDTAAWTEAVRGHAEIVRDLLRTHLDAGLTELGAVLGVHAGLTCVHEVAIDAIGGAYFEATLSRVTASAEARLRHLQRLETLGRFAGGMVHDFNNVLTVIETYAALLEETLPEGDERRQDAAEIRRAGERAAGITRQFLAMSRPDVTSARSLDLSEVVRELLPMLRRMVGRSVTVVAELGAVPPVVADQCQLEQVLLNLVANGRDAMGRGGRLVIETAVAEVDGPAAELRGLPPGRYVELAVTDDGIGMDAATQARIFEPFFTTKEVGKGTGLGLSIVHGIVAQAGGTISVYSELGRGTTFRAYLPATEGVAASATVAGARAPTTLPPMHVLVVDEPEVRAVAARVLRDAGCHVLEAGSAEEARRACVHHDGPLEVVILDLLLADGSGELLIDQLRALRPGLAFLTTSGYPAAALAARGTIPTDLLVKPFTPADLRAAVARVHRAAGPASPAERAAAATGVRRVALIVDDDAGLRRTVGRVLQVAGFDCAEAACGKDALAVLEQRRFDVVISDVHMPGGDGLELLRAVRRVDLDVPVILITGEPSVAAAAEAVQFGAFRYLSKPFDLDSFVRTAQQAARAHALARIRREALAASGAPPALTDRASLEVRFQLALDSTWMAFQPIVHARTGGSFGVEALMRSTEPSLPTPESVLDAASSLDRLPILGRRTRRLAADAMVGARDDRLLFVNLHPADLADADLIDPGSALAALASRVVLEVTERASLDVTPELRRRLGRLRELGFRLAVDDVGAGYSGLSTFAELAPELVKIDMSLVRDVHRNALKQRTIAALCRLCHEGGTLVVAEGVESADERDTLVGLGCDLFQGFLFGHPEALRS